MRVVMRSDEQRVPVFVWARAAPEDALGQLCGLARQPFVVDHVAAMADVHLADGVAVGTVFATLDTLVPRALGGDLGCGMLALALDVEASCFDRAGARALVAALGHAIPAGEVDHRGRGEVPPEALLRAPLSTHALERARQRLLPRQLGTLGGGNHFLELDRDAEDRTWLLVHSGSRGLGGAIAAHHARAASAGGARADAGAGALPGLCASEQGGQAYIQDHAFALAFARENRARLAARALAIIGDALGRAIGVVDELDVPHNLVTRERWLERDVWVHRKGAVAAPAAGRALVPGSMGTASYLVAGLGNPLSFGSCSHGAGRVMTRRQARERVGVRALEAAMRRVAFPEGLAPRLVEEAPAAYRDIGEVLDDQADLVVRRLRLEPFAVLKG